MTKREFSVRILNIVMVISFMLLYIKGNIFTSTGFYVCALYILFLILKPYMLRQPFTSPFNYIFEFFDELFVIGISITMSKDAFIPLTLFMLLRCSLLFPIYFVLLSYVISMVYIMLTYSSTDVVEVHNLCLSMLMLVIPACIVCLVKNDVLLIDKRNRELSEKLRIKNAVIDELQKYSDILFVGDSKKEDEMLRTDYVTQIPNRYYFEEMLKNGLKKAREPNFNMGIMMIYIENLYQYRIKYSYSTEHILVKRIHDLIAEQIKTNDFIARYEEDCIAVLLFNKDISNAENLARIIYSSFETLKYNEPELNDISLKIGVNDIENSLKDDGINVDTLKLLNRCRYVDFFTGNNV